MRKISYSFLAKAAEDLFTKSPYRSSAFSKLAEGLLTPEALRSGYLQHGAASGAIRGGLIAGTLGGALNLYNARPEDRDLGTFARGAAAAGAIGVGVGAGAGAYHGHVLHREDKPFHEHRTPSGVAGVDDIVDHSFRHPGRFMNENLSTHIPAGYGDDKPQTVASEPSALAKLVARFKAENSKPPALPETAAEP